MTPAARLAAAADILDDLARRPRPATEALADWGKAHRFAGSGDRAVLGNLVFDALRKRASLAWSAGSDTGRALILALMARHWADLAATEAWASGERHALAPLAPNERAALARPDPLADAPAWVAGDYPQALDASLARSYGADRVRLGQALAERAPVDLRVNTLKADRARVLAALARHDARPTPFAPTGVRVAAGRGPVRAPAIEPEAAYQKGWIEPQDEASQLAALLAGARPGEQVADVCAGGGGKTLALAALMENTGQLYAWDEDPHRLKPIHQRLERAGARNVQVRRAGDASALDGLEGRMDRVVLDVPCTGLGAWRRRPDAKWRLKPEALPARLAEQDAILHRGAALVRPGGTLAYITCSLLAEENEDRLEAFRASEAGRAFAAIDLAPAWRTLTGQPPPPAPPALAASPGLRLGPHTTGTDGFFIALLRRAA